MNFTKEDFGKIKMNSLDDGYSWLIPTEASWCLAIIYIIFFSWEAFRPEPIHEQPEMIKIALIAFGISILLMGIIIFLRKHRTWVIKYNKKESSGSRRIKKYKKKVTWKNKPVCKDKRIFNIDHPDTAEWFSLNGFTIPKYSDDVIQRIISKHKMPFKHDPNILIKYFESYFFCPRCFKKAEELQEHGAVFECGMCKLKRQSYGNSLWVWE